MQVYRLAKEKYIRDMSGTGARIAGGRWNSRGRPVLYTASSRSLATVEYLVHVLYAIRPPNLKMACIEIPDSLSILKISIRELPADWRRSPPPSQLQEKGDFWLDQGKSPVLFVPSAVVPGEHNILLNPLHPDMAKIRIARIEDYDIDPRLIP
ncbi:MAG: RES family NAD+ phosphorylase [Candidatus Sumerlaeia bacterium]